MNTVSCSFLRRGEKQFWVDISMIGSGGWGELIAPVPGTRLLHPGSMVSRRRSEGYLGRSLPGCTGPVQRNTESRCGESVSSARHTYPGIVNVSSDISSVGLRSLSWAWFPSSSQICFSTASSSTKCSSNVPSPALKGRHKSAIKASNSETMVNVCENGISCVSGSRVGDVNEL